MESPATNTAELELRTAQAAWGGWSSEGKDGSDNDGEGEGEVAMLLVDIVERVRGGSEGRMPTGTRGGERTRFHDMYVLVSDSGYHVPIMRWWGSSLRQRLSCT